MRNFFYFRIFKVLNRKSSNENNPFDLAGIKSLIDQVSGRKRGKEMGFEGFLFMLFMN